MSDKALAMLVVGLGNPGARYEQTRHNVGFLLLDRLLHAWGWTGRPVRKGAWEAELATLEHGGRTVIMLRPLSYMNLSGGPVSRVAGFYKLPVSSILVACDDVNLPFGTVRIRARGGSGGHKGLTSIIEALGRDDFGRMRIGVGGGTPGRDLTGYVLGEFPSEDREALGRVLDACVEAVETVVERGLEVAMSRFNGDVLGSRVPGRGPAPVED